MYLSYLVFVLMHNDRLRRRDDVKLEAPYSSQARHARGTFEVDVTSCTYRTFGRI